MFDPILPRNPVIEASKKQGQLERRMRRLTNDVWRAEADYEVPPTLEVVAYKQRVRSAKTGNLVKRRGKRTIGYKRTGTLKKSWSRDVSYETGGDLVGEIKSSGKVAPYNVYVRDPKKQSKVMEKRGWRKADVIFADFWPAARADFKKILGRARG